VPAAAAELGRLSRFPNRSFCDGDHSLPQ